MYKIASMMKLRFVTPKGPLTVEQLWDLSLEELDALAVSLETAHKESGKKSFLTKTTSKDKAAKLRFDIVLDVLTTKSEAAEAAREKAERKERNNKILDIIAEKEDGSLRKKSVSQLKSMLEED